MYFAHRSQPISRSFALAHNSISPRRDAAAIARASNVVRLHAPEDSMTASELQLDLGTVSMNCSTDEVATTLAALLNEMRAVIPKLARG